MNMNPPLTIRTVERNRFAIPALGSRRKRSLARVLTVAAVARGQGDGAFSIDVMFALCSTRGTLT